jgi:hypothetical protein
MGESRLRIASPLLAIAALCLGGGAIAREIEESRLSAEDAASGEPLLTMTPLATSSDRATTLLLTLPTTTREPRWTW